MRVPSRALGMLVAAAALSLSGAIHRSVTARAQDAQATIPSRPDDVRSMSVPSASRSELLLVQEARRLLKSAEHWNQEDDSTCLPRAHHFSIYCALKEAAPRGDAGALTAAQQEARLVIWDIVVSKEYDHPLTDYNNDRATTFADVQRLFRWLETRVQKRLAQPRASASGTPEDDSHANPPASAADLAIAREARRLLSAPADWDSHDSRDCPAGATTFSFYCALVEASDRVAQDFVQRGAVMQEARFVVDSLAAGRKFPHRLMDFNNDPGTGYAGIEEALRLLESRLQSRLAERR